METLWTVRARNPETVTALAGHLGIDAFIASVLAGRGIREPADASQYMHKRLSRLHNPFGMKNMYAAVARIRSAIANGEKIGIFADSDLDGLSSLAMLLDLLKKLGGAAAYRYPVNEEDYGLTHDIIDELGAQGVSLLVTLDSGIRDIAPVAYANTRGIDSIICDHHQAGDVLPDSIIVNPKQPGCRYPFKELAGVGVAFKLCHALLLSYLPSFGRPFLLLTGDDTAVYVSRITDGMLESTDRLDGIRELTDYIASLRGPLSAFTCDMPDWGRSLDGLPGDCVAYDLVDFIRQRIRVPAGMIPDLYGLCEHFSVDRRACSGKSDIVIQLFNEFMLQSAPKIRDFIASALGFVALGSIADIMPLLGENRTLIHHGIESLRKTSHPGLSLLVGDLKEVNSTAVGWNIAPRLNTPGRFGKTDLTARFLLSTEKAEVRELLTEINTLNDSRKDIVAAALRAILADCESGHIDVSAPFLFVTAPISNGLSGLLANMLSRQLNKPVIIIADLNNTDYVRGSGRVNTDFDFFSCVVPFTHLFDKIGGHPQAFGFSVRRDRLDEIRDALSQTMAASPVQHREIAIDYELSVESITVDFVRRLNFFEPLGHKNEAVVFVSHGVPIAQFVRMGQDKITGVHGKFTIATNRQTDAIGWNLAGMMESVYARKKTVDMVYTLELNEYLGQISPRIILVDIA